MTARTPEEARFLEQRRAALEASPGLRGLESAEARQLAESDPVWKLRLHFLPERPEGLGPGNFRVVGPTGEVDSGLRVTRISVAQDTAGALDVFVRVADSKRAKRLASDASVYRIKIDAPGVDRFFRDAAFRFDGGTPEQASSVRAAVESPTMPDIDYLAKDYESFRRVLLERMAAYVPEWTERNPADVGVAIVEVLAYSADYLSYYQDAVATEAYLDTARKRGSVRRHLRLLGHVVHEGCNARVWVAVEVSGNRPVELAAGTVLLTRAGDLPTVLADGSNELRTALEQGSLVFETMHEARLWPELDRMSLHDWGVADHALPEGATSLALAGHYADLEAGRVLILEQAAAPGETPDPRQRHAIRIAAKPRLSTDPLGAAPITELEFSDHDALPFTLRVSRAWARGNVVLADQGRTFEEELPPVDEGKSYRPRLSLAGITRSERLENEPSWKRAAADMVSQEPTRAVPQAALVEVVGDGDEPVGEPWRARIDLLESSAYANDFVAETDDDGRVRLRFGDGRQGRRPSAGSRLVAVYRVGNGPDGHVGHDSIAHIVGPAGLAVANVTNPLPAKGAEARESLESARLVAPRAFRKTENCVTPEDLSLRAKSFPEVLDAVTEARWTGSWQTLFLYVRRSGGRELTPDFENRLRAFLEPRLLVGADLEIRAPAPLPLEIRLRGRIEPEKPTEGVETAVLESLGSGELTSGGRGYFHRDNFTFGQPVYLDGVLDRAMNVDGVLSIEADVFRPWGSTGEGREVLPSVEPGPFEVAVVENRPAQPELGILGIRLEGGS